MNYLYTSVLLASAILLGGCAVGPDYQRPAMALPAAYKEIPPGWKLAAPADHLPRGDWWLIYRDPYLNDLAAQVRVSNQNVQVAVARYRQARASAQEARAGFLPTLGLNVSGSRNRSSGDNNSNSGGSVSSGNSTTLDASWEPDLWGLVRRSVESSDASTQASAADLAAAELSAQAELVQDYLQLRIIDSQRRLAADTIAAYRRSLQLTQNQYAAGIVTKADVAQAQGQLKTAEAQAIDLDLSRKQLEHAIAILIGKAPADFSLAENANWRPFVPDIPSGVPSDVLERRPDVASAERAAASANAQIGVARAAYFPALTLTASGGFQSGDLASWFNAPGRVWSLGASLAQFIFDGGARVARDQQAVAAYDASAAAYRQTVLGALQEVEDNLAGLSLLGKEIDAQRQALAANQESERLALNQYKAGTVSYLNVVTAQTARYNSASSVLQSQGRQLSASVLLVKALGGGWDGVLSADPRQYGQSEK